MKKALVAISVVMAMASFAHAESNKDQGHGKVTFTGSIIDAPCSIDPDSVDQKVPLGSISNKALEGEGTSTPVPFQIKLQDCTVDTARDVEVTFSGKHDVKNDKLLAIAGQAAGAGIALTDNNGDLIELGKATSGYTIPANATNATLEFSAYMQGNGASVVPGTFEGVTDFMLNYK